MTRTSTESGEAPRGAGRTTDFGFRRVAADEHRGLVSAVFDSVAARYDLMNDLMSAGLHRMWKAALIDALDPRPGMRLIDVAGGTGDIVFRALARLAGRGAPAAVTICDPNEEMLGVARRRAIDHGYVAGISFVRAPAEALPFDDRTADACTISFGLRNVSERRAALAEMYRALAIGGHFLCLEFSPAVLPAIEAVYDAYSFRVLPWLGEIVADDRDAYRYLAESIRRFPAPDALAAELREAGFGNVRWHPLTGGVVALHSAWRV